MMNANASNHGTDNLAIVSWAWVDQSDLQAASSIQSTGLKPPAQPKFDWLRPVRNWLDGLQVADASFAHRVCKLIPAQCPFERDVKLLGRTLFHIPPMCKLNPVYEQVVALRFRALCYLADECGEDISQYC
jgi:Mo-dependent nitrogenase C-terminus